jgi:hypothetical protein
VPTDGWQKRLKHYSRTRRPNYTGFYADFGGTGATCKDFPNLRAVWKNSVVSLLDEDEDMGGRRKKYKSPK